MKSIVENVDRGCQNFERRIIDLERYVDMLKNTPLSEGGNSQQIALLENIIVSLKNELLGPELAIVGVELTQAIQYFSINGQGSNYAPDNSVPLIAQRELILRVYINDRRGSQSTRMHVTGQVIVDRVHTYGPDTRVATLSPINGSIVARSSDSIDRGNPNHTLNFRLSSVQCQGQLRFNVTVSEQPTVFTQTASFVAQHLTSASSPIARSIEILAPDSAIENLAPDNPIFSPEGPSPTMVVHGRFENVPTFRVRAVLIHYTGDGMDIPAPSGLDFAKTFDFVLSTYPIGRLEFADCVEVEFDGDLSAPGGGCGPGWGSLLGLLQSIADGSDDNDIYVALVPRGASSPSILGCGNTGVAAAFNGDGEVLAQEIGHALSRKHAPSGNAPGADPDYPNYGNYVSGSIGEFGFDTSTSLVYDPARSFDFMGYNQDWISPYTYMGLRNAMLERFGDRSMARLSAGARRETLFLNFRVDRDETVEVLPSFHLPSVVQPTRNDTLSEVSCELLDQSGTVLSFHRCRLTEKPQDKDGPYVIFHETIPWIEQAAAIRFLRNREVLHVHEIEKTPPKVKIRSPKIQYHDKAMSLEWTGYPKKTELTYMIRYSNDRGATWRVVAANLRDAACQVKAHLLPGGDLCLLQVVAFSGIRTSVAQTEPFSSPLKPRTAFILSPEPKTEVPVSGHLVLRGGAFSPDFGIGDMEDAVWSSNLDGLLGRGIALVADNLSTGYHTITLTVPDGIDGVATTSVSVRVCGG